jgi:hypothetical protein
MQAGLWRCNFEPLGQEIGGEANPFVHGPGCSQSGAVIIRIPYQECGRRRPVLDSPTWKTASCTNPLRAKTTTVGLTWADAPAWSYVAAHDITNGGIPLPAKSPGCYLAPQHCTTLNYNPPEPTQHAASIFATFLDTTLI